MSVVNCTSYVCACEYDRDVKDSTYQWLPNRHLGVAATLAHADELIAQAAEILFSYQTHPDGILQLEEVAGPTHSQTVVTGITSMPRKVPLLVADALVALRNSIEHTLFAEIEFLDGELDEKAARAVEMPASYTYDAFHRWVKTRAKNGSPSLQRGSEVLRRIEGLQPFQRTKDPQNHPLALLVLHTNHSKHRAPAVTAVSLAALYREDRALLSLADVERRPEGPLQIGDVIAETPRGTQVPVTLFPTVGINRPGTDRWPALMKELEGLATWVRTQAVPRLVTGTEPPLPSLPARYEIGVGHDDERSALTTGATASAVQLHTDRLSAEVVRRDMVETIAQMDSAPSREQIAAWLQSLSVQELLTRMRELTPTQTYEPVIVFRNLEVLEAMRDDARRFIT